MGDREPSPETMAASRRIRALGKLDPEDPRPLPMASERPSRRPEAVRSAPRKPSKSPRRRERESRTPSTVREVTPRTSITPEPYRPKTPKSAELQEEERKFEEERRRKEAELKKKEEELFRKMEELKKKEEELRREEERREREDEERKRRDEETKRAEQKREAMKKKETVEWGRELSHDIHSSSEMMLVLLPNNEEQNEELRMTAEELTERSLIAPPMSLSAPVLGGCEMPPPSLRAAVSSSEIMYELTMARLNKEADEEEAEATLHQRYGLDRKRSFERKTHRKEELGQFKETSVSMENLSTIEEDLSKLEKLSEASDAELPPSLSPRKITQPSKDRRDTTKSESFTERFMLLEKSFENYSQKFEFDDTKGSEMGSDMDRSFEYYDDVEEETYHPRVAKGVFTPIAVQMPTREFAERVPSPQSLGPPPLITISEEAEKDGNVQAAQSPEKIQNIPAAASEPIQKVVVRASVSPDRLAEPPPVVKRRSPSPNVEMTPIVPEPRMTPSPTTLKPILKSRDRSAERSDKSDVSDSEGSTRRVRIEEPNDKRNIDLYAQQENDMGLQAGEVARNRRKPKPPPTIEEPIVVNIYSDIISEFSQRRRPPKKLYLNYEELKRAAEQTAPTQTTIEEIEAAAKERENKVSKEKEESTKEQAGEEIAKDGESVPPTLPPPKKLYMEYLLDLFLFFVALWLYVFKDPRLSIPILMLMVYRQLHETLHAQISSFKWFRRKEE